MKNFKFIHQMTQDEHREHVEQLKINEYEEWYRKTAQQKNNEILLDKLVNCKLFIKAEDVPKLPVVEEEEWSKTYVPLLIEKGAIPKNELEDGQWYYGNFRNSNFGQWSKENNQFGHWRMKFGWMWDWADHFEDDRGFSIFVPIRLANDLELEEIKKIEKEPKRK